MCDLQRTVSSRRNAEPRAPYIALLSLQKMILHRRRQKSEGEGCGGRRLVTSRQIWARRSAGRTQPVARSEDPSRRHASSSVPGHGEGRHGPAREASWAKAGSPHPCPGVAHVLTQPPSGRQTGREPQSGVRRPVHQRPLMRPFLLQLKVVMRRKLRRPPSLLLRAEGEDGPVTRLMATPRLGGYYPNLSDEALRGRSGPRAQPLLDQPPGQRSPASSPSASSRHNGEINHDRAAPAGVTDADVPIGRGTRTHRT